MTKLPKIVAVINIAAGALMIVLGVATYYLVQRELADEKDKRALITPRPSLSRFRRHVASTGANRREPDAHAVGDVELHDRFGEAPEVFLVDVV